MPCNRVYGSHTFPFATEVSWLRLVAALGTRQRVLVPGNVHGLFTCLIPQSLPGQPRVYLGRLETSVAPEAAFVISAGGWVVGAGEKELRMRVVGGLLCDRAAALALSPDPLQLACAQACSTGVW